jgi:hypothetical protein
MSPILGVPEEEISLNIKVKNPSSHDEHQTHEH